MAIWYRIGVNGTLMPEAAEGMRKVAKLFDKHGYEMYVNSICDGIHSQSSFHPYRRAFDIDGYDHKGKPRAPEITVEKIKKVLGDKWDVIFHNGHWHCELDRLEF